MGEAVPAVPAVPEGFERHFRRSGLTDPWEPLYSRRTEDALFIGLRAAEAHANSRGFVHGGLISALADNAMGLSCVLSMRDQGRNVAGLVTVSLTVDFLATASIGQWLQIEPMILKTGGTLAFAQAQVTADVTLVARASGVFRTT